MIDERSQGSSVAPRSRSRAQALLDVLTFPGRALTLFHEDRFGLTSLRSERFYYSAREVRGYCLDVGCGPGNVFVENFLQGNGVGIDVYPYAGLKPEQVFPHLREFPFADGSFDTITFIANINHIPERERSIELAEAFRCLRSGGRIIVTMGEPIAEVLVHKLVAFYDRTFGTKVDVDGERGMQSDESFYLTRNVIRSLLYSAGFHRVRRKRFFTQWGLNSLYLGFKQ